MKRNFAYSANFDEKTEELFRQAEYLGQGNNGIVYELPDNKVIKIFLTKKVCNDEGKILFRTNGSKYFPKIYAKGDLYVIRDMVKGERLDGYISKHGLSENLIKNIYNMLKEFKKLKFTKIDTRCKDIYVSEDETIMLIDPKKAYSRKVNYPRHLMKGLNKIGVLEQFLSGIGKIDKKKATKWKDEFNRYCENLGMDLLE